MIGDHLETIIKCKYELVVHLEAKNVSHAINGAPKDHVNEDYSCNKSAQNARGGIMMTSKEWIVVDI